MNVTHMVSFRPPAVTDAEAMWRLVLGSGRLDPNSAYCYLLLCRYFAETCLVAENGEAGVSADRVDCANRAGSDGSAYCNDSTGNTGSADSTGSTGCADSIGNIVSTSSTGNADRADSPRSLLGFVTAFVPPGDAAMLFVWQIAVAEQARGQGLGAQLLQRLLELPACRHVTQVEATVSPSNAPSRRLFESFARSQGSACEVVEGGGFASALFPAGDAVHEEEPLLRIKLRR